MSDRGPPWRLAMLLVVIGGGLAACKKASADYCVDDSACREVDTHCDVVNMICISNSTPDAEPIPCDQTHPCPDTLPFCDESTGQGVCVICGDGGPSACPDELPACLDNMCVGCTSDLECPDSGVCMDDGACADINDVLYVTPTGGGDCSKLSPCTLPTALGSLSAVQNIVHLSPAVHTIATELNPGRTSTIIGRGATIELSGTNQAVFDLTGTVRTVTFLYVTITGGDGPGLTQGNGIQCTDGITVNARHVTIGPNDAAGIRNDTCTVNLVDVKLINNREGMNADTSDTTIEASVIRGNTVTGINYAGGSLELRRSVVVGNTGATGGVSLAGGNHTIENNIIVLNGGPTASIGGLGMNLDGMYKIRFNTFADNVVSGTQPDGVRCGFSVVIDATSNIIDEDFHDSACTYRSSLFPAGGVPGGAGNIAGDPMFITEALADPLVEGFYRIMPDSAARNTGEVIAEVAEDIDGEARPESGTAPDIGADEVH